MVLSMLKRNPLLEGGRKDLGRKAPICHQQASSQSPKWHRFGENVHANFQEIIKLHLNTIGRVVVRCIRVTGGEGLKN